MYQQRFDQSQIQNEEAKISARVLLVDDETAIRLILEKRLRLGGYEVYAAADGPEAVAIFKESQPDIVVLDLMLPGIDGLEVCREIRKTHDTPVLMLSAVSDLSSRIAALEIGADDYMLKPFSPGELEARIKAILRRCGDSKPATTKFENSMNAGDLNIDFNRRQVSKLKQRVKLTGAEFNLLEFLVRNSGKAFSRSEILSELWKYPGGTAGIDTRVIDVHISRLRAKIEDNPSEPAHIVTARGIGYMFQK